MNSGKNVLLVTVDQWPGWLLGCAGHPVLQTPTLDQLARNGVRYTKAYSESPICIPARRTLMTGTATRTHGDRVFGTTTPMPKHLATLPQAFRACKGKSEGAGDFSNDSGYRATDIGASPGGGA